MILYTLVEEGGGGIMGGRGREKERERREGGREKGWRHWRGWGGEEGKQLNYYST